MKESTIINKVIRKLCRRINRLGGFETGWMDIDTKRKHFPRHGMARHVMLSVGIKPSDFVVMGIAKTKTKARRNFREKVVRLSREGGSEEDMRVLIVAHQKVQGMRHPPLTFDNAIVVLEIQKGYKSTEDRDFGLNGPY